MGSASRDDSSQKALEGPLMDVGNKLLRPPSSDRELLLLLEEAESLLSHVWQQPPRTTARALLPIMKALITDRLLRPVNLDIQVTIAACFGELTRITAPDPPYEDDQMKELFQLFIIAFKQLSRESGFNYYRAKRILANSAILRSSMLLMDIRDSEGLIIEMFRLFLTTISSDHPSDVFKHMEMIMTSVIEESDDVSLELLKPLLSSVRMDNKNVSPVSWELGRKVLENCAAILPRYLREAAEQMNLNVDDYANIVASLCQSASAGNNMVSEELAPIVQLSEATDGAFEIDGLSKDAQEVCTPQTNDEILQPEMDTRARRRIKGKKANLMIRPEGGHEHTQEKGGKESYEVSSDYYNENDLDLPSERGKWKMPSESSKKEFNSVNKCGLPIQGWTKKKGSMIEQHDDMQSSSKLKRKIQQTKVKKRGAGAPKEKGKTVSAASSASGMEKGERILSDTNSQGKYDNPRKRMEKKSRGSRVDHAEELINLRIKVWWPMDETFYSGTIRSFDPATKQHMILYDDNEIEILNLREETWELFNDDQASQTKYSQKEETGNPSSVEEPVKTQEGMLKRKRRLLKNQDAASSSKRLKGESCSVVKTGEKSASPSVRVDDNPDVCKTNVRPRDESCNISKPREYSAPESACANDKPIVRKIKVKLTDENRDMVKLGENSALHRVHVNDKQDVSTTNVRLNEVSCDAVKPRESSAPESVRVNDKQDVRKPVVRPKDYGWL